MAADLTASMVHGCRGHQVAARLYGVIWHPGRSVVGVEVVVRPLCGAGVVGGMPESGVRYSTIPLLSGPALAMCYGSKGMAE